MGSVVYNFYLCTERYQKMTVFEYFTVANLPYRPCG